MDIRTLPVLCEVVCVDRRLCERSFGKLNLRIDATIHVLEPEATSTHAHTLWFNKDGTPYSFSFGTVIPCHSTDELHVAQLKVSRQEF